MTESAAPGLDAQVGVLGVGSVGSMALLELARRGVSAIGFERYWSVPNDQSAYGGESRLYRSLPLLEPGPGDVRITRDSYDAWRELESESGHSLLLDCGSLVIEPSGSAGVERLRALIEAGQAVGEVISLEAAKERYPQFTFKDDDAVVLDPRGGWVRSELAVAAASRAAIARGSKVLTSCEVTGWDVDTEGVTVDSAAGTFRVGRLIVASGAWSTELLPGLGAHPQRVVMAWYAPRTAEDMKLFAPGRFPSFTRTFDGNFIFGGPSLEGTMVKVGVAEVERWGQPDTVADLDRSVHWEDLSGGVDRVEETLPGLDPAPVRTGVWVDSTAEDETAIMGHWGGSGRVIVATAFSGYGFKICPITGRIAAELAATGDTEYDISHMDPARLT
jgi:sarcosine oxidase